MAIDLFCCCLFSLGFILSSLDTLRSHMMADCCVPFLFFFSFIISLSSFISATHTVFLYDNISLSLQHIRRTSRFMYCAFVVYIRKVPTTQQQSTKVVAMTIKTFTQVNNFVYDTLWFFVVFFFPFRYCFCVFLLLFGFPLARAPFLFYFSIEKPIDDNIVFFFVRTTPKKNTRFEFRPSELKNRQNSPHTE